MREPVYFVHITDTHIGPTPTFSRHGHQSYACARRLVEIINGLPVPPDFIIHTGDVVDEPDPRAYALAAQVFTQLASPVYYVTGNHDTAPNILTYLPMGPRQPAIVDPDYLCYRFEVKGYRFLVLDGHIPNEDVPHGWLPAAQMAVLQAEAADVNGPPLIIFNHFPALPINAPWIDANLPLGNGAEVHGTLACLLPRLRAVFLGHVHQNIQTWRDGVLYVAAASAFSQFTAWPTDRQIGLDTDHLPGFNFVHLLPDQTIIRQHTFPRPMRKEPS